MDINTIKFNIDPNAYITTQEAAEYLGLKKNTLEKYRSLGCGPKYYKITRRSVRYKYVDLVKWAERLPCEGTYEYC